MKKVFSKISVQFLFSAIFVMVLSFLFSHFAAILFPHLGTAHAVSLHEDLTPGTPGTSGSAWVFSVWKVALALANVIVIAELMFVAVVNIVHLQYDTYAIKKSLPLLIIGIIMANFSLLICRMLVDVAQVLANTFAADPTALATGYLCGMGFAATKTGAVLGSLSLLFGGGGGGTMLIIIIVTLLAALIAIAILAFLLWIRKVVIFLLVAVAPVAFILYAFAPTQGLFKQWWGWFLRWTFMGPIVMLLMWVASKIGETNCSGTFSISALFAMCGVTYLAAIVPMKLGGPVMAAWAGFGKKITGTGEGGYLKKPIDESIQRKKDLAKGAFGASFGNTGMGRWMDRGRKNEEAHIANYKNRRDTQMADREREVRGRHAEFAENEKELERAKNRLETTIKAQIGLHIQREASGIGQEKLASINAAGDVEREEAKAELLARGLESNPAAIEQRLREKEVEYAKTSLEENKQGTEALIREGAIENLPPDAIERIYGDQTMDRGDIYHAGRATNGMDIKNRYLEQDNRLDMLKERLAKEAGEDAQVFAERDLRRDTDIRDITGGMHDIGISVSSSYNLDGTAVAGGGTINVSDAQAAEASERLRYEATTARTDADRERLNLAALHLDAQVRTHRTTHTTYTQDMVDRTETLSTHHQTEANNAATDAQESERLATDAHSRGDATAEAAYTQDAQANRELERRHRTTANSATERANIMRGRIGHRIEYDHMLSRNLAGRRQKKINPDISDEIHTAEITNSPQELINGARDGRYGTGRARGNRQDINNVLSGEIHNSSEAGARAAVTQVGAIHSNMKTARHGDAAGLESIDGFNELMDDVRPNFKLVAAQNAMDAMNPTLQTNFQMEAARQALGPAWAGMNEAQQNAAWGGLNQTQQDAALQGLDFSQLDLKSQQNTGQRDFVDRYLTQIEEDPALSLSSSPGSKLGRSRPVDPSQRTENVGRRRHP